MALALDADGLRDFLRARFPQAMRAGFHIDEVLPGLTVCDW